MNRSPFSQMVAWFSNVILFWDTETLALDFGMLGEDVLFFTILAARYCDQLGVGSDAELVLRVHNPRTDPQTVAHFLNTPLRADEPDRLALLARREIETRRPLPAKVTEDPKALALCGKRLLDGIANEFTLEPTFSGPAAGAFLSIGHQATSASARDTQHSDSRRRPRADRSGRVGPGYQ